MVAFPGLCPCPSLLAGQPQPVAASATPPADNPNHFLAQTQFSHCSEDLCSSSLCRYFKLTSSTPCLLLLMGFAGPAHIHPLQGRGLCISCTPWGFLPEPAHSPFCCPSSGWFLWLPARPSFLTQVCQDNIQLSAA